MVNIQNLTKDNLDEIANIHRLAFPKGALTKLGLDAVHRYYEWQFTGPHDHVVLGAYVDATLTGFCFGGISRGALGGFLRKNYVFLGLRLLTHPQLFTNPLIRDRLSVAKNSLWNQFKYKRRSSVSQSLQTSRKPTSFGILSIAVHPDHHGRGIGKALLEHTQDVALQWGFDQMHLTVSVDNAQAIGFYEHLGWQKVIVADGWKGRMTKLLFALV